MNEICLAAIEFIVEFLKLFLVTVIFFRIRQHKNIYVSFIVTLLVLMFAKIIFQISDWGLVYGIVSIILLIANAYDKGNRGFIVLSYVGISIIDMIFSVICITVFHLNEQDIIQGKLLDIGINSFSLIIIIGISIIICKRKLNVDVIAVKKYLPLYIIGSLSISLYLASIQFMGMGVEFSEYSSGLVVSLSLSSFVLVVLCVLLILKSNENEYLKNVDSINQHLLETQEKYYVMLLEKEDETKAFRHDIRKHIYCLNDLYIRKNYDELGKYLCDLGEIVKDLSPIVQTGNNLITAIVNDILKKYNIQVNWMGMMPDKLNISSLDLCTIFYNLLLNAAEATKGSSRKVIDVKIKFMENSMMAIISNSYSGEIIQKDGRYISIKSEKGHGYGIKNVEKCVKKNGGIFTINYDNEYFTTEIIIPHAI